MKIWPYNLIDFLGLEPKAERDSLIYGIVCATSFLPEDEYKAVMLKFTCGYEDNEIAERLSVTERTVLKIFERAKAHLLETTVEPLISLGHDNGMRKIHRTFSEWEREPMNTPVNFAFPEQQISSILQKNAFSVLGDVLLKVHEISNLRGIGKKYTEVIHQRLVDYTTVSTITTDSPTIKSTIYFDAKRVHAPVPAPLQL